MAIEGLPLNSELVGERVKEEQKQRIKDRNSRVWTSIGIYEEG